MNCVGRGLCLVSPRSPITERLFQALGTVVADESETDMIKMSSVLCTLGNFYAQQFLVHYWFTTASKPKRQLGLSQLHFKHLRTDRRMPIVPTSSILWTEIRQAG